MTDTTTMFGFLAGIVCAFLVLPILWWWVGRVLSPEPIPCSFASWCPLRDKGSGCED